jgi:hypothetical protein
VLASTILITASGVVTCAMRRTLVSRKARKRRIAENAEMSGENFYNRQNSLPKIDATSPRLSGEPKMPPMVNGAPGSDRLPAFATFNKEEDTLVEVSDLSRRTPSHRTNGGPMGYVGGGGEALGPVRSRSQDQYRGPRDEYGNPLGAAPPNLHRGPSDPNLRQMNSRERMTGLPPGPRGGFGYGGPRGRGGYLPRGGYGPPRGGFGAPRGGPNPPYGRGYNDGRGNYNGRGRGGPMAAGIGAGMAAGAMMGRPQQGPPPGYPPQRQTVSPEPYGLPGGPRQPSPGGTMRRPSHGLTPPLPPNGFVGQAVEMNANTGRISQAGGRAEDGEPVHRMVTMPPNRLGVSPPQASPSSAYSSDGAPRPPNMGQARDLTSPGSMYSNGPE